MLVFNGNVSERNVLNMADETFKIVRIDDINHGYYIEEEMLRRIIKVSYKRNNTLHKKSIEWFEHLTKQKFNYKIVGIETKKEL